MKEVDEDRISHFAARVIVHPVMAERVGPLSSVSCQGSSSWTNT